MPRKRKKPRIQIIDPLLERQKLEKKYARAKGRTIGLRLSQKDWQAITKASRIYCMSKNAFIRKCVFVCIESHNIRVRKRREQQQEEEENNG